MSISQRKQAHLNICLEKPVECGSTEFQNIHLVHHALPEMELYDVDTSLSFLESRISAPIFISCMTGGNSNAYEYNKRFAEAAEQLNIPIGLGSIRVLLEHEETLKEFQLKTIAPSVPLIANIGAAQLRTTSFNTLHDIIASLHADAIAVHLNPAQELCQVHGERSFANIFETLREYIASSTVPVIVKETGCGIAPQEAQALLGIGARYVDIAGSGGTNWAVVELMREHENDANHNTSIETFARWGNPSALLLLALYGTQNIIASGGIRTAHDIAVSLALGAEVVGLALPVLRHAQSTETLVSYLSTLICDVKKLFVLNQARTVRHMRHAKFWVEPQLIEKLTLFCAACQMQVPAPFTNA